MSVSKAQKELRTLCSSTNNWRFPALLLAHPDMPSGFNEEDLGRAWPTNASQYRRLGVTEKEGIGSPDEQYAVPEDSDEHRYLSDVTNEGDWEQDGFGDMLINKDRAIKRALAFDDSIENLDTLFRQELRETVIEGARKNQIARDAATVINVDRSKGDHPRGPDDTFAPSVAEGAAIKDDGAEHDTVSWNAVKFGQGARATDELIDQSLVDVIAQHVEFIGRAAENSVNRRWLNTLVDDANVTVDASAEDNKGWAAINEAIHQVELNDFTPDTAVNHPTFTKTLFDTAGNNTIIPRANEFGDDQGIRDRVAFPLLGIEGFRGSNGVYSGSNTWDYTAASETGSVVYDRDRVNIYMYRDLEVKEYEDPIRDLQGVNVRTQHDTVLTQPDAVAKINNA